MAHYARLTLAELKARLTARVGENSTFWLDREKAYAINEAIRVWACMTGEFNRPFQIPTTGQVFYSIPKQLSGIYRVKFGTKTLPQTSLWELDNGFGAWENTSAGTPLFWAPVGLALLVIYPPPAAGNTLVLEGPSSPPTLGADGDFLDLGDEEAGRILDYAHAYLTFKEGGQELASALALLSSFVESAVLRNRRLLASAFFKSYPGKLRDETQRPARSPVEGIGHRG